MRDELLAYLLNDLDDEQRSRIEALLDSDPIWQHELERLRSYMEEARKTKADETDPPPEDLVARTCQFVEQASAQGALSPAVLPASLTESRDATAPRAKHWTWLDMAVVASILLVMGTLVLPALRESRDSARRQQCQQQLGSLSRALTQYAQRNNGQLPAIGPNEVAGMYAVELVERDILTEDQAIELIVCPSSKLAEEIHLGQRSIRIPSRIELTQATGAQLQSLLAKMRSTYAYRIGYTDTHGVYRQIPFTGRSDAAMIADEPSADVQGFQSAHHGGCAQNVAFQDQGVRYVGPCDQPDRDQHMFLNEDGQPAAGTHRLDVVMIRSDARPFGTLMVIKQSRTQQ